MRKGVDDADVLGEPVARELSGQEVQFAPITFGMLTEFYRSRRQEFRKEQRALIEERLDLILPRMEDAPPQEKGRVMIDLTRGLGEYELEADLNSPEGAILLLTLSAQGVPGQKMDRERMGKILPADAKLANDLVSDLMPSGLVSADEAREEMVRRARRRLEGSLDDDRDGLFRAAEDAIDLLYQATGEENPNSPPAQEADLT